MTVMALQLFHPLISPSVISTATSSSALFPILSLKLLTRKRSGINLPVIVFAGKEETQLQIPLKEADDDENDDVGEEFEEVDPTPEDLEYISKIKTVLELLRKNRDMLFSEVKLTIMIEDPREVERLRLLGIDESDAPTREDLADVLEEVNEGKIPRDSLALKILAEEMAQWPNLEVEPTKKTRKKSLYAKATDTGIDPEVAAKRLNIDWDSAADIEDAEETDDTEVPSAVGYGALYLVTAFPIIIANASFIQTPVLWAGRVCIFYALLKAGLAGSPSNPLISDLEVGVDDFGFSKWIEELQSKPEKDATDNRKLVSKWHPTTKGTLRRNYKIPSKSVGMRLLRSIASLLSEDDQFRDATSHKGCQIRRESAHGESVCCNNVRALFDELPTPHLVVEITPFPSGPLTQKDYDKAMKLERVLRTGPSA